MRKNRKQQKNRHQIELFPKGQVNNLMYKPEESKTGGTGKEIGSGSELLSVLERERALTENIMERIVDYVNLNRACQRVIQNGGSSGVDGMDVKELRQWYNKNHKSLRAEHCLQRSMM